jgi:ferredoxin
MSNNESFYYSVLARQTDSDWAKILDRLSPSIHPVDRRATRIWFAFFPVKLHWALAASPDQEETASKLLLKGKYRLTDQVDSSAEFLYGHRYWPDVKREVAKDAMRTGGDSDLPGRILEVAQRVAKKLKVDDSHIAGITAVTFGTLQQVGPEIFNRPAQPGAYGKRWNKSPDRIVAERAKDDGQGIFGFLKTVDKEYSVNFREYEPGCRFKIVNMQDVTMAATNDKRDHQIRDKRCMPGEGPIPVECRTSSCGTCWVGVLSPTEKVSPPGEREIGRWTYFGYEGFTGERDSPIRLACQIKAYGNVTIVIPPWNGMIGKLDE